MKKKPISTFIMILFFLAGLSLLLYPFVANQWNNYRQSRLISSYDETVSRMEEEGGVSTSGADTYTPPAEATPYPAPPPVV